VERNHRNLPANNCLLNKNFNWAPHEYSFPT
jgi:hypothetical protein